MPSERDQAKDGLFARAPSTSPASGTCCGAAAAGHPSGTMALVTLAETKVTRAVRRRCYESMPVSGAEPASTQPSKVERSEVERELCSL